MDENALNIRQNQDNLKTKIQITLKLKSSKHFEFIFKRALWVYITNLNINIFNVRKNMHLTRFFKLLNVIYIYHEFYIWDAYHNDFLPVV